LKNKLAGKFIVLDGPDGCGKTTQTKLLVDWLKEQGAMVETFREPGGTAIGEKIRQILLNPEHIAMSTAAEVLLYMASRAQLWEEKIAPTLKEGKCVVLDRWLSSTCAYQRHVGSSRENFQSARSLFLQKTKNSKELSSQDQYNMRR